MSKRAEQRGLEALPPRWRKTKDGKGKVDSALPVRKFYIRVYEQAEKDLALTWQDIRAIDELLTLVYDPDNEEGYYTRVLEEFNKGREER